MATMQLEIITAEQQVFGDEVEMVVAPGIEGQLGILPHHAPLMTALQPGERQGLRPRLRRPHRRAEVDLPHASAGGRVRERHLAQ